ncbi:uncharacterized protein LOC6547104 [Drosophila erecta]|uniref:MARVEL domain-containing protein n=1 Tax=Drosophila erecta TaxID=7220 RepID=B3NKC3_DROER|nr:uncharacterized protein LOC6547104 [Drosophila erecta]EDV55145.1 uncharacterized protein Dere_GG21931 [Drosophila erecta]
MKINLTVENGPCNTELRGWCLAIAIYWLLSMTSSVILAPNALNFVGFAIIVVANICLLIGTLREKFVLLLVWLIFAAIEVISFPFAVLGVIFHFGGYREATGTDSVFLSLVIYIITFLLILFSARIVYSFYLQLKNNETSKQTPRAMNVV